MHHTIQHNTALWPHEGIDGKTGVVHIGSGNNRCTLLEVQFGSFCTTLPILEKHIAKNFSLNPWTMSAVASNIEAIILAICLSPFDYPE